MTQPIAPHVPKSQQGLPRTSVGEAWDHVYTYDPPVDMVYALQRPREVQNGQLLGFTNPNNLCYRNSVLSILLRSQRFLAYIRGWHVGHERERLPDRGVTALPLLNLIARRLEGDTPAHLTPRQGVDIAVSYFWTRMCNPGPHPRASCQVPFTLREWWNQANGAEYQQDASEYLSELLNIVKDQLQAATDPALQQPMHFQTRNLDRLFHSRWGARQVCKHCDYQVRLRKPVDLGMTDMDCLRLRLPAGTHKKTLTVQRTPKPLAEYVARELKQTFDMPITCPRCGARIRGPVYYTLRHAPEILFIVLQREHFVGKGQHMRAIKVAQSVEIPEVLDMTPYLDPHDFGKNSNVQYSLSGVVSHSGDQITAGHYISFVRSGSNFDQWCEVNDSDVRPCSFEDFNDSNTEILGSRNSKTKEALSDRFTPFIMMYERDNVNSKITPGRVFMNPCVGGNEDRQPPNWHAGVTQVEDTDDEENEMATFEAFSDEEDFPAAELDLSVSLGDHKFDMPKHFIRHFDPDTPRSIELEGSVAVSTGRNRKRKLDLAEAHNAAESDRRRNTRRRLRAPPGNWASRWKNVRD